MPHRRRSFRRLKLLLACLLLGTIATSSIAWRYYSLQRDAGEQQALHAMGAMCVVQVAQIENWRRERIGDGAILASAALRHHWLPILAGRATGHLRADILSTLHILQREYRYLNIAIVHPDGTPAIQSNPQFSDPERFRRLAAASPDSKARLTDLGRDPKTGRILLSVVAPLPGHGALILDIDAGVFLLPYLARWPGSSHTAESLLIRLEGDEVIFLSPGRDATAQPIFARIPRPVARATEAQLRRGYPVRNIDYRGHAVLVNVRRIPDSPWLLACKIDTAEIDAPFTPLAAELIAVVLLFGFAGAAGVWYVWRAQQLESDRATQALRSHFDTLTRYANDIIILADPAGRIVEANQHAAEEYGYSPVELGRLHICDLAAPEAVDHERLMWSRDDTRGTRFESTHCRKDGTTFAVDVSTRTIEARDAVYRQAIIRDISDRVRAEREARALGARLISAQEAERSRLARELHDALSQQIAALSIAMGTLKRKLTEEQTLARQQCDHIQQKLVETAGTVRQISHGLHPASWSTPASTSPSTPAAASLRPSPPSPFTWKPAATSTASPPTSPSASTASPRRPCRTSPSIPAPTPPRLPWNAPAGS